MEYFINLAETLNFTTAARLSGVSQPSLTRAIRRLEEELGGPLIYRDGKNSRLTALGQEIYTGVSYPNGHYNHLDLINRVRYYGSVRKFIDAEHIDNGIIYSCEECGVPYVLGGSIRDDGPLPPVYGNVYEAQDAMRSEIRGATTVIGMATMLHSIATGNMTPSYRVLPDGTVRQVYFFYVDVAEFTVNKLSDRGSLSARGIVTNVQDFIVNLANGLNL